MNPVAATINAQRVAQTGLGLPRLLVGQLVSARVVQVDDQQIQLQVAGQIITAETELSLVVGQLVQLEVQRSTAGQILLKMVDPSPAAVRTGQQPLSPGPINQQSLDSSEAVPREPAAEAGRPAFGAPAPVAAGQFAFLEELLTEVFGLPFGPPAETGEAMVRPGLQAYDRFVLAGPGPADDVRFTSAGAGTAAVPSLPPDLAGLLADLRLPADPTTVGLVAALIEQGAPLDDNLIRALRRQLVAAGASADEAPSLVLLARLNLPATPTTLVLARELLAGQHDPRSAWADVLGRLEGLVRSPGNRESGSLSYLAQQALAAWSAPASDDPPELARWLRSTLIDTALPLEAKLAGQAGQNGGRAALADDVRVRLDSLQRAAQQAGDGRVEIQRALGRLESSARSEQLLNSARMEPTEPRYFIFTLPSARPDRGGSVELSVREREHGADADRHPDYLRLRLQLPSLGEIRVNLTVHRPSLTCHFATESQFAASLLRAGAGDLAAGFQRLGYGRPIIDAASRTPSRESALDPFAAAPGRPIHHVDLEA